MDDPTNHRCRVVCDFDRRGELIQVSWELWERGELKKMGMMPVGPFDTPREVERHLAERLGVQVQLDLG